MASITIQAPESVFEYLAKHVYKPIVERDLLQPFLWLCKEVPPALAEAVQQANPEGNYTNTPDRMALKIINDLLLPLQKSKGQVTLAGIDFNRAEVLNQLRPRGHGEKQINIDGLLGDSDNIVKSSIGILSTFALVSVGVDGPVTYAFSAIAEPRRSVIDGKYVTEKDEHGNDMVDYYTSINVLNNSVAPALGFDVEEVAVLDKDPLGDLILRLSGLEGVTPEIQGVVHFATLKTTKEHSDFYKRYPLEG